MTDRLILAKQVPLGNQEKCLAKPWAYKQMQKRYARVMIKAGSRQSSVDLYNKFV